MAINIKEILSTDSNPQKDEKINYNFDQVVANGGGPIGTTGSQGASGSIGATGPQGATGAQGSIGPIGLSTDYFVQVGASPNNFTLTPSVSTPGTATTLVLGEANSASLTGYSDSVLNIKSTPAIAKQLRLSTDDVAEYIDLQYTELGNTRELQFVTNPVGTPTSVDYKFNGTKIVLNDGAEQVILSNNTSVFNSTNVEINSNLKITSGTPGVDKVLTSSDANGTATWVDTNYYTPAFGTIAMIPNLVFDAGTTTGGGPGQPTFTTYTYVDRPTISPPGWGNTYGKGLSDWAGWYLCNGEEWTSSDPGSTSPLHQYRVPDMRDRFPLGFSFRASDSTASKTANTLSGSNLETVNMPVHTHPIQNASVGNYYSAVSGQRFEIGNSATNTTFDVDIKPESTTLGYMVYLGPTNLAF